MSSNSDGEFAGTSPDRDIKDAHGHVRIGAIEREAALAALGQHFREGRLTVDEYSARCVTKGLYHWTGTGCRHMPAVACVPSEGHLLDVLGQPDIEDLRWRARG